ncbi:Acg family FMN-binding oxidoreductase [Aestuariispira insulae]|uniref:Nitroreductase family protein n=1 Tax=Aestuariispira insulae TaxID=1461337 RepID=A0A3D9HF48_9PROT|nr:twin-arginine translocation pathway signal protein [Aestuariispira insulae]RED48093.1 hypothetical protein DFP90_108111 [Aestuariispira insulae]
MDRRTFLKIAGLGSSILVASAAGFALTRDPSRALTPWRNAGKETGNPLLQALSYALLAPNPHNRQPWIVHLKPGLNAALTCDLDRLLPATDPFNRQITIGLGCFLETFRIAAAAQGYAAAIDYFPEGEPGRHLDHRPIAHLTLRENKNLAHVPLFPAILTRRTNRTAYDLSRPLDEDALNKLTGTAIGTAATRTSQSDPLVGKLRKLTRDAMLVEMRTKPAHQESIDLMRIGKAEIEANPDGISLGGPVLEAMNLAGILTRETLNDPTSMAFRGGLEMVERTAMTAMGFAWITTPGNSRTDQILAGRSYMRLALGAETEGIAMQPMSQALQEYPEMASNNGAIHELLAPAAGDTVQMLARLGYADRSAPSPRWPLETFIKKG